MDQLVPICSAYFHRPLLSELHGSSWLESYWKVTILLDLGKLEEDCLLFADAFHVEIARYAT